MRAIIGCLALWCAAPALSQESAGAGLSDYLYEGRIAEGIVDMAERDDPEARFALGVLTVLSGLEDLAQALYRHGFSPERGIAVGPFFAMAQAEGAVREPEPLTYEAFRGYLGAFVDVLDEARPILLDAEGDYATEIAPLRIRLDIDGNGDATATESIGAFVDLAMGTGRRLDMGMGMAPDFSVPDAVFAFDMADAIWLAGYTQVLALQADFLLAHDFERMFDAAFHRLFPGAGLSMERFDSDGSLFIDRDSDALVADAIALIHTINWPVIDRERVARVQDRLADVISLSRRNWQAILAETDDHLEFVPSPSQSSVYDAMAVTKPMVEAWLETLDVAERIVSGALLLPHWRYGTLGFYLDAYFSDAERTDFVLLFSGLDALPFLKEGEIADAESFAAANAVFGGSIWSYAFWFN